MSGFNFISHHDVSEANVWYRIALAITAVSKFTKLNLPEESAKKLIMTNVHDLMRINPELKVDQAIHLEVCAILIRLADVGVPHDQYPQM